MRAWERKRSTERRRKREERVDELAGAGRKVLMAAKVTRWDLERALNQATRKSRVTKTDAQFLRRDKRDEIR
jgi:hypothetical protein